MTTTPQSSPRKRLLIIGAGFAGLNLARSLRRRTDLDIILVDKRNYHLFQPLLYQVATAALSPADIAYPIRRVFRRQPNVRVVLGAADRIDLAKNQVCGGDVCVDFDYLAVCCGATHSYFGKDDAWRTLAPGLKDLDDATEIRRRVLLAFEEAELENDEPSRRAKLTFVVVGGGPTGVELAGALREIAANDIQRDFRNIDTSTARIILLQGGERLLPQLHPSLGDRAKHDLESMGVEVRLNSRVTDVTPTGVTINTAEHLPAQNVIWAAGVAAPKLLSTLQVPTDRSGRVIVSPDLSVPGHPNVFVLGDAAAATDPKTNQPIPGLAPAAIQMGKHVARIIAAELDTAAHSPSKPSPATLPPSPGTPGEASGIGDCPRAGRGEGSTPPALKPPQTSGPRATPPTIPPALRPPFHYRDKGIMATIGTHRAVADIRGLRFGGTLAWLAWSLIHVTFLIGFRSRLFVMAGWIYDYLTNTREARLITGAYSLNIQNPRRTPHVHLHQSPPPSPAPRNPSSTSTTQVPTTPPQP